VTWIGEPVVQLFASVSEAVARATYALLQADTELAAAVISADDDIDRRTAALERRVWDRLERGRRDGDDGTSLRELVAVLLILPELERSADLAEHIAQRARANLGEGMTPASRGIVQRMGEVAVEMWQATSAAWMDRETDSADLVDADEELDILHARLTAEVATGGMDPAAAAQVTLIARFYERLGDHAVNLARRVDRLRPA
jgi:phosphate transport system protein